MKLRNFTDSVEGIAERWAANPFADRAAFKRERDGQSLDDVLDSLAAGKDLNFGRLGWFDFESHRAFLKTVGSGGGKVASDLGYYAGLPVCPQALLVCPISWNMDEPVLISASLKPFDSCGYAVAADHPVYSVAAVLDTLVNNFDRNISNVCCNFADDADDADAALFDFEAASYQSKYSRLRLPHCLGRDKLLPDVCMAAAAGLRAISEHRVTAIIERLGSWTNARAASVCQQKEALPDFFAQLIELNNPHRNINAVPIRLNAPPAP